MQLIIKPDTLRLLSRINSSFNAQGIRAYLTGGFVRDLLLGRDTTDIDIAVTADALDTGTGLAATLGGHAITLDTENRVCRVLSANEGANETTENWQLDLTTIRESIEQDLRQRDFTINAMAIDLEELAGNNPSTDARGQVEISLIDPCSGEEDIHQNTLRAVSEAAFEADPVRLLRAVRLAAELGFSIEPATEALVRRQHRLISHVAGERVREELRRLLAVPRSEWLLPYLDRLGLLTAIFPELEPARGSKQPQEHHWEVLEHSLQTVAAVDFLLRQGDWQYASREVLTSVPWSDDLTHHFESAVSPGSNRRVLLKLAALLHDIAKPHTKTTEKGRIRFLGHPQEGAAMTKAIMERLRFSNRETRLVTMEIEHHLRPSQMSHEGLPSRRAIYRYFRDTGDAGKDILFFSLADHLATRGPGFDLARWQEHTQLVAYVLDYHAREEAVVTPPKLLDGHDLINTFRLTPGPQVGQLLEMVREARAAGEIASRDEALSLIRRQLLSSVER